MTTENTDKPKRTRGPNKPKLDAERILEDLQKYCEISIAVIEALQQRLGDNAVAMEFNQGQLSALKAVQARITVKA